MWSLLTLMVYIVSCSPACRGQEGDSSCEYSYLLQPPSELPCNPFRRVTVGRTANERNVTKAVYSYSVNLTCVVAQTNTSSELNSKIRWIQMLGDSGPECLVPNNKSIQLFMPSSFHSKLQLTGIDPRNGNDSYWCELSTDDIPCNSSNIFANKLTINEPKFYKTLPPCPDDIYFHLAERVCVTNSSCSPNSDCSDEDDGSEDGLTDTEVITIVFTGVVALILLTVVVIVVWVLRRVKGKSKQQQKRNTKTESAASIVLPVIDQEQILTPPTSAPPIFREENGIGVSGNQLQVSAPSPVVQQRPSVYPPTRVKPLKVPESARKRAISLLRRSSKGANKNVTHNNEPAHTNTDSRTHEDGPTPRKKPYKTLELDTVEDPHLYTKRDKSPIRRQAPTPPKKHPQHRSRQKVLLTETMSSGYVNPGEVETVQQQMYKVIDPDTQDYLAVYNVPHHLNDSPSEDEQPPIYEEPRQFD